MKSAVLKILAVSGVALAAYPVIASFKPDASVSSKLPDIIRPKSDTQATANQQSATSQTVLSLTLPTQNQRMSDNSVMIKPNVAGHFIAKTTINGISIPLMFDTGASIVALSYEDAVKLGIRLNNNDFRTKIQTANGTTNAAEITLKEIRLENIVITDVPALILPAGKLETSLMGRSFWGRLKTGFSYASGNLILKN